MLPDGDVGGDAVLAVVEEDNHAIGVHGLASEELEVLEVGDDLLGEGGSTLLEGGDLLGGGTLLLELSLDGLHVAWGSVSTGGSRCGVVILTLEVGEVALLVELGLVETERVDDIDLGLDVVVGTLLGLLSGSVGTSVCVGLAKCWLEGGARGAGRRKRTEGLATNGDLGAVGLVGDAVNLLEVVRVGDDLVTGDNVLGTELARRCGVGQRVQGGAEQGGAGAGAHLVDDHGGGCGVSERLGRERRRLREQKTKGSVWSVGHDILLWRGFRAARPEGE